MGLVRRFGVILAVSCVLVPAWTATASASEDRTAATTAPRVCTAFGRSWMHKYNAEGGPIKIVSACCALRSPRTHNAACTVMVTGRKGMMGDGMFGCSVATVAVDGNILANKPLACVRARGLSLLPA